MNIRLLTAMVGLREQSLLEFGGDLYPIRQNRKIHSLELVQAKLDVGFPIVNEQNSYRSSPVCRDATDDGILMILVQFVMGQV